jgi:hypothetical protein
MIRSDVRNRGHRHDRCDVNLAYEPLRARSMPVRTTGICKGEPGNAGSESAVQPNRQAGLVGPEAVARQCQVNCRAIKSLPLCGYLGSLAFLVSRSESRECRSTPRLTSGAVVARMGRCGQEFNRVDGQYPGRRPLGTLFPSAGPPTGRRDIASRKSVRSAVGYQRSWPWVSPPLVARVSGGMGRSGPGC